MPDPPRPTTEHHSLNVNPEGRLLSETLGLLAGGLLKGLKQAKFMGQTAQIAPESFVAIIEVTRQLAVRVEKLEGIEHPEPGDNGKAEPAEEVEESVILA